MTDVEVNPVTVSCLVSRESVAGTPIESFHLRSPTLELRAMTYGGIITSVTAPDRAGVRGPVVLGHGSAERYFTNRAYLGAIVGRYASRIRDATFALDGRTCHVDANEGANHLHGGHHGFDRQVWTATTAVNADAASVTFWRLSPDGEGGFPGALGVAVTYTLTAAGTIVLDYEARAHASTVVNLTQHTYFNLSGDGQRDAREHELTIHADRFIPVERDRLPVGTLAPVKSTPFDFRAPASIGGRLDLHHSQLDAAGGFDHTWALPSGLKGELVPAARLHDPRSGRTLAISTTEPGLQFYDGHLLGIAPGDAGSTFHPFAGVCLETQHYPDSPNRPDFPTTVVRPGRPYRSTTTWQLGIE